MYRENNPKRVNCWSANEPQKVSVEHGRGMGWGFGA